MLDIIIGFIVAVLAGLGVGGGGLLVIWLVLFNNMPQLNAQATNLIFFIFSSVCAVFIHLKKRKLNFKLIVFISFFGIIGAIIGSICAKNAEPAIVRKCFGIFLLISGFISLSKSFRK